MQINNNQPTEKPSRRRARQFDGKFKGDNPETPDVNEAWEPTEAEAALDKEIKYSIRPLVNAPSVGESAGKYSQKPKIRPTFGTVTSTTI